MKITSYFTTRVMYFFSLKTFLLERKKRFFQCDDDESDSPTHLGGRSGGTNSGRHHRKEEIAISGVCTLKRVHLFDPACDIGVSVWRGRGPQTGVRGHQKPPLGVGPALLLETRDER